jgi:hypothetical protein
MPRARDPREKIPAFHCSIISDVHGTRRPEEVESHPKIPAEAVRVRSRFSSVNNTQQTTNVYTEIMKAEIPSIDEMLEMHSVLLRHLQQAEENDDEETGEHENEEEDDDEENEKDAEGGEDEETKMIVKHQRRQSKPQTTTTTILIKKLSISLMPLRTQKRLQNPFCHPTLKY